MGEGEITKDAIRIMTTAGLSKDVIDLLKEKISLLAEQNTTLEKEKAAIEKKATELERQLANLQPREELHQDSIRFLKVLYQSGELPTSPITGLLGMDKGRVEYHRDKLLEKEMISWKQVVGLGDQTPLLLEPKGRAYLIERGHV